MDWRLGRLIRAVPHPGNSGSSTISLGRNPQRVGVLISGTTLGALDLSNYVYVQIGNLIALKIQQDQWPYLISLPTHGELSTLALGITDAGDAEPVFVTEFFLPEEYLTQALEEFKRSYQPWKK